jgi:hypothetical protein
VYSEARSPGYNFSLCTAFADGVIMDYETPATFGSGEHGEDYLADDLPPGDIAYGLCRSVPPAR